MADRTVISESSCDAWNRHDAAAFATSFAVGGVYVDPLTRVEPPGRIEQ